MSYSYTPQQKVECIKFQDHLWEVGDGFETINGDSFLITCTDDDTRYLVLNLDSRKSGWFGKYSEMKVRPLDVTITTKYSK